MLRRNRTDEDQHERSREEALAFLERVANEGHGAHTVSRNDLARAAKARQARRAVVTLPA
jgi:hypothetical protein